MRLEQLEFFVVTAETHSMQKTAELLHTTIQNISKSIRQLEQELNVPLFNRTRHGTFLTADGQFVYQEAQDMLSHLQTIQQKYKLDSSLMPKSIAGNLRILTCMAYASFSRTIVKKLYTQHPSIHVAIDIEEPMNISHLLLHTTDLFSHYDAIITGVGQKELTDLKNVSLPLSIYILDKNKIGIRISASHPLAQYSSLSLKMLLAYPLVTVQSSGKSLLLSILEDHGVSLTPSFYTNSSEQCDVFIADSLGYGFSVVISEKTNLPDGLKEIPLNENFFVTYLLILPDNTIMSPLIRTFKQIVLKHCPDAYRIR